MNKMEKTTQKSIITGNKNRIGDKSTKEYGKIATPVLIKILTKIIKIKIKAFFLLVLFLKFHSQKDMNVLFLEKVYALQRKRPAQIIRALQKLSTRICQTTKI